MGCAVCVIGKGNCEIRNFESAQFLQFKSEIGNLKLDWQLHVYLPWPIRRTKATQFSNDSIISAREPHLSRRCFRRRPRAVTFRGSYCVLVWRRRQTTRKPEPAESRADFIHKLRIVLKELNETKSWLDQIVANGLFSRDKMGS